MTNKQRTEQVVHLIKKKFGTITEFCREAKRDRYQLQKFFANCRNNLSEERAEQLKIIEAQANKLKSAGLITDEMRARLRVKCDIIGRAELARKAGVSTSFVTYILDKRLLRRTKKVNKLFKNWVDVDN